MATSNFFETFITVDEFKQKTCGKVVDVIRLSNRLAVDNFEQLITHDTCQQRIDAVREKILHSLHRLNKDLGSPNWNQLELDEIFEQFIDANDTLFERVASSLDEADGVNKSAISTVVHSQVEFFQRQVLTKPQLKFKRKVDNSTRIPFIPKIRTKPNAKTPLSGIIMQMDSDPIDLDLLQRHPEIFDHPYFDEIEAFEPDEPMLTEVQPQLSKPLAETKCLFVETVDQLKTMMDHIELQPELAIDLEHHSYRSYQGFTCLMQISSRSQDFLIDTIALRDDLHVLNNIFTNPKVVKVFHGADWDIEWLQKDFGLYVVNMFDTHQAAKELNLSALSLAYLLKSYCDIDANKQFQLADWRIRPLPEEFLHYAREDTHYLLYIYDRLRNRLLDTKHKNSDLLRLVYAKSKIVCQKLYKKPVFDENAYQMVYLRSRKTFNCSQLTALKLLYSWRDQMARHEDESPGFVLPELMLIQLSELLPKDIPTIRASFKVIPELVTSNLNDIHRLIVQAIEMPISEPIEPPICSEKPTVVSKDPSTDIKRSAFSSDSSLDSNNKRAKLTSTS